MGTKVRPRGAHSLQSPLLLQHARKGIVTTTITTITIMGFPPHQATSWEGRQTKINNHIPTPIIGPIICYADVDTNLQRWHRKTHRGAPAGLPPSPRGKTNNTFSILKPFFHFFQKDYDRFQEEVWTRSTSFSQSGHGTNQTKIVWIVSKRGGGGAI